MQISLNAPTEALRAAFHQLLTTGVENLMEPLFPGIPVYADDEPEEAVAPFLVVDMSLDPAPWGKTDLWGQRVLIKLVQPVSIPTDANVSLDYDSAAADAYEHNLECLIRGRWLIDGETFDEENRTTYRNLTDWLTLAAAAISAQLVLVDAQQVHSPTCTDGGKAVRTKQPLTNDRELEYDFMIVGATIDAEA